MDCRVKPGNDEREDARGACHESSLPARGGSARSAGGGEKLRRFPTRPPAIARVHPPLAGRESALVETHCGLQK